MVVGARSSTSETAMHRDIANTVYNWFASYVTRVSLLGLGLAAVLANAERWAWLDPVALFVSTIATVMGWLALELWRFSRMRVLVYDEPSEISRRS